MRKLFTLAAALLASFSLWADPTLPANATPSGILDVIDGDADVAPKFSEVSEKKLYTTYSLGDDIRNTAVKSLKKEWVAAPANDGGGSVSSITWEDGLTDAQKYGFRTASLNKWGIHSSRYCGFRVTNCTEAAVSTKSNGSKDNKTLQLQVFVKNGDNWDFVEAIGADKYNNSKAYVLTSSALDGTKEYVILLTSGSSSGSDAYELRFASAVLSPSLKAITIADVDCNIIAAANSTNPDTIRAELPYGTVINDAIDAITESDVTLGGSANTYSIASDRSKLTVTDGDASKDYVFDLTVNTSISTDASLKALKINGVDVKGFAANILDYKDTIVYTAALPVVTADVNDPTANAVVTNATEITKVETEAGTAKVVVTAQDGFTTLTYTIAFVRADAVKKINEVILSNKYSAYIIEGQAAEPYVINGFYLAGEDAPTVESYKVNDGTTWAQEGNNITLTGADATTAQYSLVLAAVEPVEFTADKITFDGTETWVKSGYGWDNSKKWKFSKTDSDYSREIAGKTHLEMFLPACDTIVLTEASVNTRDIRVYANGVEIGNKYSLEKNKDLKIIVEQAAPFMLTIASAQTGGDGGIAAIRMAKKVVPTAISNTEAEVKAIKVIENGQFFIIKNGIKYNANGAIVK